MEPRPLEIDLPSSIQVDVEIPVGQAVAKGAYVGPGDFGVWTLDVV